MTDLTPRVPQFRPLLWEDGVELLQEAWQDLMPQASLYIAGGAVRDAYWHRPIKDLDLTTDGDPIRLGRKLADRLRGDLFIMDAERGVVRIWADVRGRRWQIDVTRFRGASLLEDLQGRDFTINALAVDARGDLSMLIDPIEGERDAHQRVLRACGAQSIADDPIRALRAVRQSLAFNLRIEPQTLAQIRRNGSRLNQTSAERVRDEFFALLSGDRVASGLRLAQTLGLLLAISPLLASEGQAWQQTLLALEKLEHILLAISPRRTDSTAAAFDLGMLVIQLDRYRAKLNQHLEQRYANERPHRALLMLACLCHALPETEVEALADSLRLSNAEKRVVVLAVTHWRQANDLSVEPLSLHRFWYPLETQGIDSLLLGLALYLAQQGLELRQNDWLAQVERVLEAMKAYFERYEEIVRPTVWFNGTQLMEALGLKQGRALGRLLEAIREAQVQGQILEADGVLDWARDWLRRCSDQ
ncbi:MAG: hypothetical protein NZ750_00560 [Anaerolineae bacterium]|nr:hypothetical protein [Anaerolineae bacterium]MDW8173075.1 hypothetical protein [Anaerolineae bacterium]